MNVNSAAFKEKCKFIISLRYELFLSLSFTAKKVINTEDCFLAREFKRTFSDLTRAQITALQFSDVLPSLLPAKSAEVEAEDLIHYLSDLENTKFTKLILKGLLHDEAICDSLQAGEIDLKHAINKIGKIKKEWLSYLKLYPYNPNGQLVKFLKWLLNEKEKAQIELVHIYELWWQKVFSKYWESKKNTYEASMKKYQQVFDSSEFEDFLEKAMLKIRIGDNGKVIEALRGGYSVSCKKIDQIYLIPSAFNIDRIWSSLERHHEPLVIYFPFLDLDLLASVGDISNKLDLDPALLCRAIGDPTRFAMMMLLSKKPLQAIHLAQELDLTRATVSHHVKMLKEAGAVECEDNSRNLQLNWGNLSKLSEELISYLQH